MVLCRGRMRRFSMMIGDSELEPPKHMVEGGRAGVRGLGEAGGEFLGRGGRETVQG